MDHVFFLNEFSFASTSPLHFMYIICLLFHTIKGDMMKEIMSYPIIVGKLDYSIYEIASLMKQHDIGFLPIAKENKIVGVITDRDLVVEALANEVASNATVENYITHRVISIEQNASIEEVLHKMSEYQVKRILVTENNKVVGVIAFSDLLNQVGQNDKLVDTLKRIDRIHTHSTQDELEIDEFYL